MSLRTLFIAVAVVLFAFAYLQPHSSTSKGAYHADLARTPGVVNPDVTQANIAATVCRHGWTRTIRPPTDYTNALKLKQMREYGVGGAMSEDQEDHLISLELGGAPPDPPTPLPPPPPPPAGG